MLNNKGQSLVLFILIIPIFLLLLIIVIDVGNMLMVRRELDNINYIALDYGIKNIVDENLIDKINEIITKNDPEIKVLNSKIEDKKIYLVIEKKYKSYFLKFINKDLTNIKSSYIGYYESEKEYIERLK